MTGNVVLRDVLESDLPGFFEDQQDPVAVRMAAFPPRDREAFLAHWAKIMADGSIVKKTILLDGEVAGNIGCYESAGRREVGYWIRRDLWGKGIATRALAVLLEQVAHRPLYAHAARHNLASIRVLEKCGFTLEGEDTSPAPDGGAPVEELVFILAGKTPGGPP
jgi:RimJ/RimL family protein N-acetyltransferase